MEDLAETAANEPSRIPAFEHPRLWAPLLASATTAAVFWPAVHNDFVDLEDTTGLGGPWLRGFPPFQPDPFTSHLTSVLLHSLNAALFAVIAAWLLRAAWRADDEDPGPWWWGGLAALLFSLHPLRVESVAWAAAQRDLLCGSLCLISLLGYLRSTATPGRWVLAFKHTLTAISMSACASTKIWQTPL